MREGLCLRNAGEMHEEDRASASSTLKQLSRISRKGASVSINWESLPVRVDRFTKHSSLEPFFLRSLRSP